MIEICEECGEDATRGDDSRCSYCGVSLCDDCIDDHEGECAEEALGRPDDLGIDAYSTEEVA